MRKSTKKKAKFENEAQEPSAKKNRSNNRIRKMDDDTTVEVFKYLKYCGLAKTSLVSKQFCDLIRTNRNRLAVLDVKSISMQEHTYIDSITGMKIFDKVLSAEEYNEWVIRNGYSKQIPLEIQTQMEGQVAGMEGTQYARKVYWLSSHAYEDSTPAPSLKELSANIELSHESWPVFHHFFRLLTDPFVYIRYMLLPTKNDALNLLASAITPDFGRLQCHSLCVRLCPRDNEQNVISWIKGHVHCYKVYMRYCALHQDNELLNFFMTGANCTSKIVIDFCDPCKAIGDLIQKFIDLKSDGEDKVVESIECKNFTNIELDALIRAHADFAVERNVNQTSGVSNHVFDFVNNDIGKKLRLTIIRHGYVPTEYRWKLQICNALCLE